MFGVSFDFEWQPFKVSGLPFCFAKRGERRLSREECSHWGAVIYKWEGRMLKGPHEGKVGILIGETDDLRARINQYATGTQPNGNAYWRAQFLDCCEANLFILRCTRLDLWGGSSIPVEDFLRSKNGRLIMEQLLILHERNPGDKTKWIINKWD